MLSVSPQAITSVFSSSPWQKSLRLTAQSVSSSAPAWHWGASNLFPDRVTAPRAAGLVPAKAKHVRLWKISSCQKRGRYDILFLLQPSVPPPAGCSPSAGVKRCPPLTFKRGPGENTGGPLSRRGATPLTAHSHGTLTTSATA
ncbi:hypothetical protein MHYP_G00023140 [Metynnis hypsauchen]